MDFLDALCAHVEAGGAGASAEDSAYACILGSGGCGKSTLLAALGGGALREDAPPPPPTVGMDYSCVRCPLAPPEGGWVPPLKRDVLHVFEMGGSASAGAAGEWLQIPLTPQRLPAAALLVALDCGRPLELCAMAERVLASVRRRVEECCEKLAKAAARGGSGAVPPGGTPEALHAAAAARLALGRAQRSGQAAAPPPEDPAPLHALTPQGAARVLALLPAHPDAARLLRPPPSASAPAAAPHCATALPLPVIIVAARWDLLRDAPAPARAALLTALRFIALAHGAALVATARGDRGSLAALRTLLLHAAFGCEGRREAALECGAAARGLPCAPAGADCLEDIASASAGAASAGELGRSDRAFEARLQPLAAAVRAAFGGAAGAGGAGEGAGEGEEGGEGGEDSPQRLALLFPEPSIDALVAAKEEAARAAREARERERRMSEADKRAVTAAAAAAPSAGSAAGRPGSALQGV